MLQFSVVKKLRNRLHVKVTGHHFTEAEAAYVEDTLLLNDAIVDVTFYTRSSQIAIKHNGDSDAVRDAVLGSTRFRFVRSTSFERILSTLGK